MVGVAGAKLNYSLTASEEKAAFLCITYKAKQEVAENNRTFIQYVKQNHKAWVEHARNELGIVRSGRDFILVHGFVKTVEWIVGASRGGHVEHTGSFQLEGGTPLVVGHVTFDISHEITKKPQIFYLSGPDKRVSSHRSPSPSINSLRETLTDTSSHSRNHSQQHLEVPSPQFLAALSSETEEPNPDQCVFLNYYQVRWRLGAIPLHIRAGAGPHQLPRDPGADGGGTGVAAVNDSGSESDVETNTTQQQVSMLISRFISWAQIFVDAYLVGHPLGIYTGGVCNSQCIILRLQYSYAALRGRHRHRLSWRYIFIDLCEHTPPLPHA